MSLVKILHSAKARAVAALGLLGSASAFAQEASTGTDFSQAVGSLETAVTGTLSEIGTSVLAIVTACVVIWAIPFAWRKLRGSAGR